MRDGERDPDELDQRAAAERLGVHEATIKRWVAKGKIPSRKIEAGPRLVKLSQIDPDLVERARRWVESRYARTLSPDTTAELRSEVARLTAELASLRRKVDKLPK